LPWAGLASLVLVLVLDGQLTSDPRVWDWTVEQFGQEQSMEAGVALDQAAFTRLAQQRHERTRVFIVGTSRAQRGLDRSAIEIQLGAQIELVKLTHPGLQPYEIDALSAELIEAEADVVVLTLSEFDTHRPLRIMAQTGAGSLAAIWDLVANTDARFLKSNRHDLMRLALAACLDAYRYRELQSALGWRDAVSFRIGKRLRAMQSSGYALGDAGNPEYEAIGGLEQFGRAAAEIEASIDRLGMAFRTVSRAARWHQLRQVLSISRGLHAEVQLELLRAAVSRMTRAGIAVVVFELPLHPLSRQYYDYTIRADLLQFLGELATEFGITVVTEEMGGPYVPADFQDLTHANDEGAAKFSSSLARSVLELIAGM
jgi:hypothetical protein